MTAYFKTESELGNNVVVTPIYVCRPDGWAAVQEHLTAAQRTFADARSFNGEAGQRIRLPNVDGHIDAVIFGAGPLSSDATGAMRAGTLSGFLPEGHYVFQILPKDWTRPLAAIGWGLGAYKFDKYLEPASCPTLILSEPESPAETEALVASIALGRDLINTPAGDMGPEALHAAATKVANKYGADITEIIGDDLLTNNLPMIHAVGRASYQAPRLVEFEWGDPTHPRLALVGKGITFDTGGLNIKSAAGARIMKKDMGGAAHALALAQIIMANNLPIRLHVLLAIAENAISGDAYRPGDILPSRKGLTVEIDNTDAEGRLVLGDALTKAGEDSPALIIDFATLTGAARVALGPTLPPFFSNREGPTADILAQGLAQLDPLWRMPLWRPYMSFLSSPIADMKNAGGSFAGCITAALFLEKFVDANQPWMHFDVYGWNSGALPGHPKGGEMFALRALYHWLKAGGLNSNFSA